ncbi:MAG: hypothetical protein AAGC93_09420 [Cyanobacteria bacterium P01_F01_bin.53]
MTSNLYRKAFASAALAVSMLLTSFVSGTLASNGNRVHGLTGRDLLNGRVSMATTDEASNQGITASQLGLTPSEPSPAFSRVVHASAIGPATGTVSSEGVMPKPPSVVDEMLAQQDVVAQQSSDVAQDVFSPVDDTFAPLSDDELRNLLLIDPNFVPGAPGSSPASGFGVPSAYGADWGDAFVGLSGVTSGRNDTKWDGSFSTGIGFGDAIENVGVEVSVGIISLDGFADDGTVGVKLHKVIPQADNLAVALGWSNAIKWGDASNAEDTFYGVVTKRFNLRPNEVNKLPLTASLGVGTGAFRSKGAIAVGDNTPNVFGSLGLRVIPELSVVSGWTGSALGLGVSAAPFDFPLVFTAGVTDVTDNTSNGPRFTASMGYSFSF